MDNMFENPEPIPTNGTLPDYAKIGKITKVEFKVDQNGNPNINGVNTIVRTGTEYFFF